jgi:hypothetical protein
MKIFRILGLTFTTFCCGHAVALQAWGWAAVLGILVVIQVLGFIFAENET